MTAKRDKRPKWAETPRPAKSARYGHEPPIEGFPMAWRFSSADRGGPFAWEPDRLSVAGRLAVLLAKLQAFEALSLAELRQQGSHPVPLGNLAKPARDRLEAIEQDDLDDLFSLRLDGRERLWCVQDPNIMRILWWDPDHQVCPSNLKHT